MEVTVIVEGSYAESCALSAASDSKLFRRLRMVPWVYPFSTQCQYHHAEKQWPTLVKMDFASLFDDHICIVHRRASRYGLDTDKNSVDDGAIVG
jgi:hypothetical protein